MEIIGILILCGLLGAFALLLGITWGVAIQKQKCKSHTLEAQRQELEDAAQTISDLVDEMGIVKELRYERACKEELMSLIRIMFCLGYFKDPNTAKKRIEAGIQDDGAMDEENFAIAQMYREILRRIGPIPSEKE